MPVDKVNNSRMDAEFSHSMMIYQSVKTHQYPTSSSQGYHPGTLQKIICPTSSSCILKGLIEIVQTTLPNFNMEPKK